MKLEQCDPRVAFILASSKIERGVGLHDLTDEELDSLVDAVAAAQKERDAKIADGFGEAWGLAYRTMTDQIATAIRESKS